MSAPSQWTVFWRTVVGRAYPRIIGAQREKSWVFFEIFLPLLQVTAYVYIYRAIQAPPEFIGFVVLGGAMSAYWLNVLWSMASQLY
jgi:ABC-2 type transport system permease protein